MSSSEKRFQVVYEQKSFAESTRILVDRQTGVCYLHQWSGAGGGVTLLVDAEGRPVLHHPTDD